VKFGVTALPWTSGFNFDFSTPDYYEYNNKNHTSVVSEEQKHMSDGLCLAQETPETAGRGGFQAKDQ
jgi:hypothetical protein